MVQSLYLQYFLHRYLTLFLFQVTAAFIANLGAINTGMMMGFSAVTIPQLLSATSSLVMTKEQTSWFGKSILLV